MFSSSINLYCSALSDIGYVRSKNEDAFIALPQEGFFVLADGMGGAKAGEVAAKRCVELIAHRLKELRKDLPPTLKETQEALKRIVQQVNVEIHTMGKTHLEFQGMGTTCCIAFVYQNQLVLAHVGDSRVYQYVKDVSQLQLLTQDHSLVNELLQMGEIEKQDVDSFPYKHVLTRAIGTDQYVEPELKATPLRAGAFFLMCSDGLSNFATDAEINLALQEAVESETGVQQQVEAGAFSLVSCAKRNGGGDNITVILLGVEL